MIVNGGGYLVVSAERDNHIKLQRRVQVQWNTHVQVPTMALTPFDTASSMVILDGTAATSVIHNASLVTDDDGPRQARVRFSAGTAATAVLADGSTVGLTAAHIRATELTVGETGPLALPGEMPRHIAYNYAVELSLDEAETMGAVRVDFDRPVYVYVDNFTDYEVGGGVPVGYFDTMRGHWVAEPDGRIMSIVAIEDGRAVLNVDGVGTASPEQLSELDITLDELQALVEAYDVGDTFWRVGVTHFSTWDCNWPYLMPGAAPPPVPTPETDDENPDFECGSLIQCENRTYSEMFGIAGTPFEVAYHSHRTPGDVRNREVRFLARNDVDGPGSRVDEWVEVDVAGRHIIVRDAIVDIGGGDKAYFEWEWDGRDFAGRTVSSPAAVELHNCATFPTLIPGTDGAPAATFGERPSSVFPEDARFALSREELSLCRRSQDERFVRYLDSRDFGLGGTILTTRNQLDLATGFQLDGDGTQQHTPTRSFVTLTSTDAAGSPARREVREGRNLRAVTAGTVGAVAVRPSGNLVFSDTYRLFEADSGGLLTRLAGREAPPMPGLRPEDVADGSVARTQQLGIITEVELGPNGSVWLAIHFSNGGTLFELRTDGTLWRVAGRNRLGDAPAPSDSDADAGDEMNARDVYFQHLADLVVASDGNIYFIDVARHRIRNLSTDGRIHTVAGSSTGANIADLPPETPAAQVQFRVFPPQGLALDRDNNLLFAYRSQIFQIREDGVTVALTGFGEIAERTSESPMLAANYDPNWRYPISTIEVDPQGRVLFADDNGWWQLTDDTVERLTAPIALPTGTAPFYRTPLQHLFFSSTTNTPDIAFAPNGDWLFYSQHPTRSTRGVAGLHRATKGTMTRSGSEIQVASDDGSELQLFDNHGRMIGIRDAADGRLRTSYEYDGSGRLARIVDESIRGSGHESVEFSYDTMGALITAPYGEQTRIAFDPSGATDGGWVQSIEYIGDPDAARTEFSFLTSPEIIAAGREGLLESYTDRRGYTHEMRFGPRGRLISDEMPASGYRWTLTEEPTEYAPVLFTPEAVRTVTRQVTMTGATGQENIHRTTRRSDGLTIRELIVPDGTVTRIEEREDGQRTVTGPSGMVRETLSTQDPATGAPRLEQATLRRPSGASTSVRLEIEVERRDSGGVNSRVERLITNTENPAAERVSTGTFTRTATGARHELLTAEGRGMAQTYDVHGRLTEDTPRPGAAGLIPRHYTYDADGRLLALTQGSRTLRFGYTDADVGGPASGLPERAAIRGMQDPLGRWSRLQYDALGRMTQVQRRDDTELNMSHDEEGRLAQLDLPNTAAGGTATHRFGYEADGRETRYDPPALPGGMAPTVSSYGPGRGQVQTTTLPGGRVVTPQYDTGGRIDGVVAPIGTLTRSYAPLATDPAGTTDTAQLRSSTMPQRPGLPAVTTELDYDGVWLTEERTLGLAGTTGLLGGTNGLAITRTFGTDAEFRLESLQVEGGMPLSYGYDDDSLLTDITFAAGRSFEAVYDPDNGLLSGTTTTIGGSTRAESWTWNEFGEPSEIRSTGLGGTLGWSFTYDNTGQISDRIETNGILSESQMYSRDPAGRLTDVFVDGAVTPRYHYEFDVSGNRVGWNVPASMGRPAASCASGGALACAEYDVHDRLLRYGTTTFAYDDMGQMQSRTEGTATTAYDYDVFGNLRGATLPGGTQITYAIDAMGRRVGRYVDGTPDRFWVYQDGLNPLAQFDDAGNLQMVFVYGLRSNVPEVILMQSGEVLRVIADQVGSVRRIVDVATGTIWQDTEYSPFGVIENEMVRAGFDQPFRFAGGHWDTDTQLIRFGARDYDPATGRWTCKDPIRFGGGTNLYEYAAGNPIDLLDANGRFIGTIVGAIIGGIAGGIDAYDEHGTAGAAFIGVLWGAAKGAIIGTVPWWGAMALGGSFAAGEEYMKAEFDDCYEAEYAWAITGGALGALAGNRGGAIGLRAGRSMGRVLGQARWASMSRAQRLLAVSNATSTTQVASRAQQASRAFGQTLGAQVGGDFRGWLDSGRPDCGTGCQ